MQITTDELRRMTNQEGLILQGCGGDAQEWAFPTMRSHACWSPGKMRYGLVRILAYAGMWQRRTPS